MSKRRRFPAWLALLAAAAIAPSLCAQDLGGALSLDRLGYIQPGNYLAGDRVAFELDSTGGHYLLRLQGSHEVFVLYVDHGTLGGRILKYDSGETALRVAGWGGVTLYTDAAPAGLPAVRTGDSLPPEQPSISLQDMQSAASDESERLAYLRRLNIRFSTDWSGVADNAVLRGFAFDTMENTARGIERYCGSPAACAPLGRRVGTVSIATSSRPTVSLNGRTLIVTFDPAQGFSGRASSRAIARALRNLLPHQP